MTIQFDDDKHKRKLDDLKKIEEEQLVSFLAQAKYNISSVNLSDLPIENEALRSVREEDAREWEIGPFKLNGKNIHVAVRSPQPEKILFLEDYFKTKGLNPTFYMASLASLEKVWERYVELSKAIKSEAGVISISGESLKKIMAEIKNMQDIKDMVIKTEQGGSHITSKILEVILAGAISINASDIHFEPEENTIRVRLRLDGVLQELMEISPAVHKFINSRIKLISGLKITTTASAQDGRFSFMLDQDEINLRVSVMPGAYGESVVLRILNPKSIRHKLEDAGIEPALYQVFMDEIKKPNGLILLTGPTGSGKTTTLYSFLQRIYSEEIKIITIEDPIEYHLPGISQTQVEEEKGYTFLSGLRSALRQDPDVIMVGEIRDAETAKTAVQSALTGHLVFSTLHTNNAAGVIPRLIDLDVNPQTLVSALSLSVAQRLVRVLCPLCKKEKIATGRDKAIIDEIITRARKNGKNIDFEIDLNKEYKIYEPVGCEKCNHTGYNGRMGIFEAIQTDEEIEKIIINKPSERDIKKISVKQGTLNMQEDGVIKVLKGITSLEEVRSVVDLLEE
jgi:type II secretory ATPase GspE/PulE/Tfp pilus assembly ATPase PilB-like protein